MTNIKFTSTPVPGYPAENSMPSIILFDSLDGRIHTNEKNITRLMYFEYGEIRFDGKVVRKWPSTNLPTPTDILIIIS